MLNIKRSRDYSIGLSEGVLVEECLLLEGAEALQDEGQKRLVLTQL